MDKNRKKSENVMQQEGNTTSSEGTVGKPLTITIDTCPPPPEGYEQDLKGNEDVEKMSYEDLVKESVDLAGKIAVLQSRRKVVKYQISLLHVSQQMAAIANKMTPDQKKALSDRLRKGGES